MTNKWIQTANDQFFAIEQNGFSLKLLLGIKWKSCSSNHKSSQMKYSMNYRKIGHFIKHVLKNCIYCVEWEQKFVWSMMFIDIRNNHFRRLFNKRNKRFFSFLFEHHSIYLRYFRSSSDKRHHNVFSKNIFKENHHHLSWSLFQIPFDDKGFVLWMDHWWKLFESSIKYLFITNVC